MIIKFNFYFFNCHAFLKKFIWITHHKHTKIYAHNIKNNFFKKIKYF